MFAIATSDHRTDAALARHVSEHLACLLHFAFELEVSSLRYLFPVHTLILGTVLSSWERKRKRVVMRSAL